jgi:hypothetical protein
MKKLVLVALFFVSVGLLSSVDLQAQTFKNGDMVGNAGFGFGWYGYGYGFGVTSLPMLSLSLEKGIKEVSGLNNGVLSVGGIVGVKHASWSYYGSNGSYNDIIGAARVCIHANLFDVDKLDTYAGVGLGLRIHNENYNNSYYPNDNYIGPLFAIYAGARYYFSDKLAGFGEIGAGLGYLTLGLSYKFN